MGVMVSTRGGAISSCAAPSLVSGLDLHGVIGVSRLGPAVAGRTGTGGTRGSGLHGKSLGNSARGVLEENRTRELWFFVRG